MNELFDIRAEARRWEKRLRKYGLNLTTLGSTEFSQRDLVKFLDEAANTLRRVDESGPFGRVI